MKQQKQTECLQGYLIAISLAIIVIAAVFLCIFVVSREPKVRDIVAGKDLQNKIDELPSKKFLEKKLETETTRVQNLFLTYYQKCV